MNIEQIFESEKDTLLAHWHIQLPPHSEHGPLLALHQRVYISSTVFSYLPLPDIRQPGIGIALDEGSAHSTFQGKDVAGFGVYVLLARVDFIKAGAGSMPLPSLIEVDRVPAENSFDHIPKPVLSLAPAV
jgi:hypothetical protein